MYIDEASVFFKTEIGAHMIDYFVRLSRSMGGVIVLASQNVTDSIDSKASETIQNALAIQTCMLLKSGHQHLTKIGYNSQEKEIIEKLGKKNGVYTEIFRKVSGQPMILRSLSNPFLYWLCTNDPLDDDIYYEYEKKHRELSYSELIGLLAKDYPQGHYSQK